MAPSRRGNDPLCASVEACVRNLCRREGPMSHAERIASEVASWEGVTAAPHRFGAIEFRYGRRGLGHVRGDRVADLRFPRRLRDELVAAGRAEPQHWVSDSGWVSLT